MKIDAWTAPLGASVLGLVLAGAALGDAWQCDTKQFGNGGWISNGYVLAYDAAAKAGAVLDGPIYRVHKAPIPVDLRQRSGSKWEFRYKVDGVKPDNSSETSISYLVSLNTQTRTFNVSGILHGADNRISGSGRCKRID